MRRGQAAWWMALACWTLAPLAVLALRALTPAWRYPQLWPDAVGVAPALASVVDGRVLRALWNSMALALATGPASAVIGFTIGRAIARASPGARRVATAIALFMVVAPPAALGVGLQVASLAVGIGGTPLGVFAAHLVPAAGYSTLFAVGVYSAFDFSQEDQARSLGASTFQVLWRITLPLLRARIGEVILLGGLVSWGQVALTLLVGGGLVRTLPVELLSFVQSGNDQLAALAALLVSVPPMLAIGVLQLGVRRTGAAL